MVLTSIGPGDLPRASRITPASGSPPSYELSSMDSSTRPKLDGILKKFNSQKVKIRALTATLVISTCSLIVTLILFYVFVTRARAETASVLELSKESLCQNTDSPSPVRQYQFYVPKDFSYFHGGDGIIWSGGYIGNDEHAKGDEVAVWSFLNAEAASTWYVYTKDLKGDKQWISDVNGSLGTTNDVKQRKPVKMDLGNDATKIIKSTLMWDDQCLTIHIYSEHVMEAKTSCDDYELRPIKHV